ncbi:hypothetical protein BLNAU_5057 [Blattamonas nauphoetae]|uniref:Uncharacterized protein n=1 Tax=Blattamonas nauphoetae TaxID=2049346 RepID=A0ABQ9Y7Y4_9EUKA|nr:hypothetical protein BLNAU_5057 [Blattamonas nauphoetae]
MHSELSTPNTDCPSEEIPCETSWNISNVSLLFETLNSNDEDILITTLGELQKVADESSPTDLFGDWCPFLSPLCSLTLSSGLLTELMDLLAILYWKSPSFVRSSLSSEIPSFVITQFGDWSNCPALESCCSCMESLFFEPAIGDSLFLQNKDLIVSTFDKIGESPLSSPVLNTLASSLQTILSSISSIDEFISFPDSNHHLTFPDTPPASGVTEKSPDSLRILRDECVNFVDAAWLFFAKKTTIKAIPRKSSFTSTILDPHPFCENVIRSLKLNNPNTGHNIIKTINRILSRIPQMKESFISANLVERMFKTFDFASLPLSESQFHWDITRFVGLMIQPIMKDKETYPTQCAIFRVSVFEPVRQHVGFVLHNWKTLTFGTADTTQQESCVCLIVGIAKDMELESDELDSGFVNELVRWEVGQMVEIENETNINRVIQRIGNMIWMWKQREKERLKRRDVLLREEGWDDVFELRVVGIELDTEQYRQLRARQFRIETRTLQQTNQTAVILRRMSSFNSDRR